MNSSADTFARLKSIPIFRSLSTEDLHKIVESPDNRIVAHAAHELIIRENDVGDCMYVVLEGTVDMRIRSVGGADITIATLSSGDYFGEQALLPGSSGKRNASVHSLTATRLFQISKQDVLLGVDADPQYRPTTDDLATASEEERVRLTLRSVRLFRSLTDDDFETILGWTDIVPYEPGELVLHEWDVGDNMYVVMEGTIEIFVDDDAGNSVSIAELSLGHYFGEQALLPQGSGRRNANVRAKDSAKLIRIAREYFRLVLNRDQKLTLVLERIGDAQRRLIEDARPNKAKTS